MSIFNKIYKNKYLWFFGILLFFPRPFDKSINEYIVYFVLSLYMTYIIYQGTNRFKDLKLNTVSMYLVVMSICFQVSNLIMRRFSISNMLNGSKPIFMMIVLIFSEVVITQSYQTKHDKNLERDLSVISIVMVIGQLFVSIFQLFRPNLLEFLYLADKSRPIGTILRLSGTLNNPNTMAWVVMTFVLIYINFEEKLKHRAIFSAAGMVLILLSGSRSSLLLYPFSILLFYIVEMVLSSFSTKKIIKLFFIFFAVMTIIFVVLYLLKDYLPYMSQIFQIFEGGLGSVNSFALRFEIWKGNFIELSKNTATLMFGTSKQFFTSSDNDLIYATMRHGLIGFGLYLGLYLVLIKESLKTIRLRNLLLTIIFILFITGIQAETMTSWMRPIPLFLLMGMHDYEFK